MLIDKNDPVNHDAIIISDLHLGSEVCQSKAILSLLKKIEHEEIKTNKLLLNGDVFDSWDFRRIRKNQWKILSSIRNISKKIQVIWLSGNHDGPSDIISHLIGVDIYSEYILDSGDKKILILHGDIFDRFIVKHPVITYFADIIYKMLQKIDKTFWIARKAKQTSKTFLRCTERIKDKAIIYAKKKGCDIVCCGHTHLPLDIVKDNMRYVNSGCWTELPAHYIIISNGDVDIEKYLWKSTMEYVEKDLGMSEDHVELLTN